MMSSDMQKPNIEWIKKQLTELKVPTQIGNAVIDMVDVWSKIPLNVDSAKKAIDLFGRLALNHAVVDTPDNEVWIPARPGAIKVADEVRVISDAFDGELGPIHNGRKGVVVAVRYGDIIVNTTDGREPELRGTHYSPYKLEKRVQ